MCKFVKVLFKYKKYKGIRIFQELSVVGRNLLALSMLFSIISDTQTIPYVILSASLYFVFSLFCIGT
jgi:hypothetical protein